jgi:hypothetical protein
MQCVPLEGIGQYDCVVIVTDHSDYDYRTIVDEAQLVVDTRNATAGISSSKDRSLLAASTSPARRQSRLLFPFLKPQITKWTRSRNREPEK